MTTPLITLPHFYGHAIDNFLYSFLIGIKMYFLEFSFNGFQHRHMLAHFMPFNEIVYMLCDYLFSFRNFCFSFMQGFIFQFTKLIYINQRNAWQAGCRRFYVIWN